MTECRRRAAAAVLLVAACFVASAAAQEPFLFGTWMLNASQSNLGGAPIPQSQTVTFRTSGADGILAVEDTVYVDGVRTIVQDAAKSDGREYPLSGSAQILVRADTVSLTKVNASTMKWTYKKGEAVVLSLVGVVSPDLKTLTLTTEDDRRLVYEKQAP